MTLADDEGVHDCDDDVDEDYLLQYSVSTSFGSLEKPFVE